jgi:hypothetical protein
MTYKSSLVGESYICMMGMVRKSPEFLFETMSTVNFVIQCKDMKLREPT